ncbi:MFS transporter [Maridesulfovibrio frigidus]|uniref:MFS transporter n=1 Tax=Maridesulfovibrio frigidus TaxID=340956 RepID=UPI000690E78E|nr:MFS transporter [Maridesulfovibrio frigidus]
MTQVSQKTRNGMSIKGFSLALAALSSVVWMGTSIFIPGLPEIGRDLSMSSQELSATLTLYFVSFAAVMIVAGPLSDAWGRRNFVLTGLALFCLGSLVCPMADSGTVFLAGRVIQGLGVGLIQVPTLAMVRDECPGPEAYTVLGLLGAMTALIPILSMLIGGVVIEYVGWRVVFYILTGVSIASGFASIYLGETLPKENRPPRVDFAGSLKNYRDILLSNQILLVAGPLLMFAVFQGAYLVITPLSLQTDFGLTPTGFAIANILIIAGIIAGQLSAVRAVKKFPPKKLFVLGAVIGLAGSVLFSALDMTSSMSHVIIFMAPLTLLGFSFGFIEPISLKSLFAKFKETSGMASASYVSLLLICQGIGSTVAGMLMDGSFSPQNTLSIMITPLGILMVVLTFSGRDKLL